MASDNQRFTTENALETIMLTQVEILDRIEHIERRLKIDSQNPARDIDRLFKVLSRIEEIPDLLEAALLLDKLGRVTKRVGKVKRL